MIPHTHLNGILAGLGVIAGYSAAMCAMTHKGAHRLLRCWTPLALGLALFFASWYVVLGWQPPETFHCVRHCFPWGD